MSKIIQETIIFSNGQTRIGGRDINVVLNEINVKPKDVTVREYLSLIVTLSKAVFTTKYITEKTMYSRQTISEIHNMKYNASNAHQYIYYMSIELNKLGYDVKKYGWHELYKILYW